MLWQSDSQWHDRIFHTIGEQLRIRDLIEHNGIDSHRNIIFRDYRLRREIHHLFLQIYLSRHTLNKRNFKMDSCGPCGPVGSQTFQNDRVGLRNNFDTGCGNNQQYRKNQYK